MSQRIAQQIGLLLKRRGLTLAVAESCTGGLLGHTVTQVAGSSDYFLGGVVSYSNAAKKTLLGVRLSTLKTYGAVSRRTAAEMACGVRRRFKAGIALSITGIAGPGGGGARKPVGLVYIGLSVKDTTSVRKFTFRGTRTGIKKQAVQAALLYIRDYLTK
jgi:nicotinamide-nucleotide amidase